MDGKFRHAQDFKMIAAPILACLAGLLLVDIAPKASAFRCLPMASPDDALGVTSSLAATCR